MNLIAVAAPMHQHTEVASTPSTGVAPVTVGNYLGGAAILSVLVVMVAAGLSSAGMMHRMTKQSKSATVRASHSAH
jgi:uncharacterized protein HemX